jgi:predicted glycogen debranching enzyme
MVQKQEAFTEPYSPSNAWNLHLDRDRCHDVRAGFDREWIVTNGLGGYASTSIVGATTRSYHGLLVAAFHPPVQRIDLVAKVDEDVYLPGGVHLRLGTNEYQDGTIDPQGYTHLESVVLESAVPCFTYRLSPTLTLEKRIWMEYGQNTTCIQYTLHGSFNEEPERQNMLVSLNVAPMCVSRDHHCTTQGNPSWHFLVTTSNNQCSIQSHSDTPLYHLIAGPTSSFIPTGLWYWHLWHRKDAERGLPPLEDCYQPGIFHLQLAPGTRRTLVFSAESLDSLARYGYGDERHEEVVVQSLQRHQRRDRHLLTAADPDRMPKSKLQNVDPILARLVIAADQFIVARPDYANATKKRQVVRLSPEHKTIIAGYPWFTDWGRDSMISLPGLLLSTNRYGEARGLLKAFALFARRGLIPNRFPDNGEEPEYNTVDATLWMFHALGRYFAYTQDWTLLKELFPVLREIIQWHVQGTDYGIGLDPADGLLHAGAHGTQLTWMDVRIDDMPLTSRWGKPVEVNALWYNALTLMESWSVRLSMDATYYSNLRNTVRQNFAHRFWYEAGGYLYDVVDVADIPDRNDSSLRPNQLFAASLSTDLLTEPQVQAIFQQVTMHLLTPVGIRSLSPTDPAYHAHFAGDQHARDSAYHQGAAWPWLLGAYVDVYLRLGHERAGLRQLLEPLARQLTHTCLGMIDEVMEPESPFSPGGCFAQAWSVAELLRCWLLQRPT